MRIVCVSDLHLGYSKSESTAFKAFLNELPTMAPDYFILNGDIFELWRRDIIAPFIEFPEILAKLKELSTQMQVVLIAGNHDWHFMEMNRFMKFKNPGTDRYPIPFNAKDSFSIPMGTYSYKFVHGHQYDFFNTFKRSNNLLCYTTDTTSGVLSQLSSYASLGGLRPYSFDTPGYVSSRPVMLQLIRIRARLNKMPDEFLIYGHTHDGIVDMSARYADSGCWVDGVRSYLLIEDNNVTLVNY